MESERAGTRRWTLAGRLARRMAAVVLVAIALGAGIAVWRSSQAVREFAPDFDHDHDHERFEHILASLPGPASPLFVLMLAATGAVVVASGVLTLRLALRPVNRLSAAAALVGPEHPGVRLPTAGLPGELEPLVGAINTGLARLERAIETQRRFGGDAAHALRTPLAVLTARIDLLGEGEAKTALLRDVDRMGRLVDQMLRLARLEGMTLERPGPVDLRAVAVDAVSALAPLAVARGIELSLESEGRAVVARGNREALVLAAQNLIENALSYAPRGSRVEVETAAPACLRVLDRGPGVAEADREAIFARFRRGAAPSAGDWGAGDRGAGAKGAGLGLAIVAEIAASHGGTARADARPGGGAAFSLELA
jgi:signal transduction histidine kinase